MPNKISKADMSIGRSTNGTFFIKFENDDSFIEATLSAEDYAKASTGMAVKCDLNIESQPQNNQD